MSNETYLRPEEVAKIFNVTVRTLLNWDYKGKIKSVRTKGGHRRFLRSDIIPDEKQPSPTQPRRKFCYCRVSSPSQKEDLGRQVEFFRINYPNHEIVKDTGSGLNFKRKGLNSILESAFE